MAQSQVRIAVDAMGGDLGPLEVVRGVELAITQLQPAPHVIVVGDMDVIGGEIARLRRTGATLEAVHTTEVIGPDEAPKDAYRKKPRASVAVAAELVRDGQAAAMVSVGNTGAAMAAALRHMGRIPGVSRPAIAAVVPTVSERIVMLDMGANVDCSARQLLEFAVMGLVYCRRVLERSNPRVALLSNGAEASKGNSLTKQAHKLLSESLPEFCGNIEAREAFYGKADVVVCDGFDGNIMLKCAEGVAALVLSVMKEELTRHPWMRLALLPFRGAMRRLSQRLDYRGFGGAPLLGVNGVCIIGHGSSDALAVSNAIRVAAESVGHELVGAISEAVAKLPRQRASEEKAPDSGLIGDDADSA